MKRKWYEMNELELESALSTSAVNGLGKKEAAKRRKSGGENIVFRLPHGSFSSYLKDVMSDSTSLVLIFAALIASLFQNTVQAYVISALIALNCAASVLIYVKAHRVLESMDEYSLPGAKVVRDGHLYLVGMSSLVPGDLIYLKAGDIVPADARVIGADGFFVSENGITSNVSPVRKSPQNISPENESSENMFNMVFASSVVIKGSARAIVVETGGDTLVSATDSRDLAVDHDNLDAFILLKKYGTRVNILMLVMIFVIMFLEITLGLKTRGIYDIFLGGMSLAVAAMSEFYTAFGYVIVACGLFPSKMGRNKHQNAVILKNVTRLEKLRDINCVIFKKDGVLTKHEKRVDSMYASGTLYRTCDYDKPREGFEKLIESAVVTTGQYMKGMLSSSVMANPLTPDEQALIECAKRYELYNVGLDRKYPLLSHTRTETGMKIEMTIVRSKNGYRAYARALAREAIDYCNDFDALGVCIRIDKKQRLDIDSLISEYEKVNAGVYVFMSFEIGADEFSASPIKLLKNKNVTLVGIMTLRSQLFDGCALTVEKLKNAGIRPVLFSSGTAEEISIAKSLGICTDERDVLTPRVFESMTDETLGETIHAYSVYAGLDNNALRKIVSTLKSKGHNVAYYAHSLSEISLLDSVDIGFAQVDIPNRASGKKALSTMASSGTDALRFKADVVISDSEKQAEGGICAIERSILTAKHIYKNLRDVFAYFTEVQFARLFIVLYSVLTRSVLLEPLQILVGGLIFDFLAVLSIAFSKQSVRTYKDYANVRRELANPIAFVVRNALFGLFWAALTLFVPIILSAFGLTVIGKALSSTVFISFTLLELIVLAEVKRKDSIFDLGTVSFNPMYVMSVFCAVLMISIGCLVDSIGNLLNISKPTMPSMIAIIIITVCVVSLHEIYKVIVGKDDKKN